MPANTIINLRRGSATAWSGVNPVLSSGEPGFDLTNKILKIGDGSTPWNSLSSHSHFSSDIIDFSSSISGLLPITNVIGGTNISVVSSGSIYTVSVSGQLGLTAEQVDDRVASLLTAGNGIRLTYNDVTDSLVITVSGAISQTVIFGGTP